MTLSPKTRQSLLDAYGSRCHICGQSIDGDFDVDHVKPKKLGGTDDLSNLAPAHVRCNRTKQAVATHVTGNRQFTLSGEFKGRESTKAEVFDLPGLCRGWLLSEIEAGRTAGDLPTRFYRWLTGRLGQDSFSSGPRHIMSYGESMALFLGECSKANIKAKSGPNGRAIFFVGEVLPKPRFGP